MSKFSIFFKNLISLDKIIKILNKLIVANFVKLKIIKFHMYQRSGVQFQLSSLLHI